MDRRARAELDLDDHKTPQWSFAGFTTPGLTDDDVVRSWHEYRTHGVLLVSGGYIDQPLEWWRDMDTCEAMYKTRLLVNEPEWKRKLEEQAKHARSS